MNDALDEVFFEALEKANLITILGGEGRLIMLKLSQLCMQQKMGKESQAIAEDIFKATENKNWLSGIMAIFFALDMMIQNNPLIARKMEDKKAIDDLIKELETKMREKMNREKDNKDKED